MECMLIQTTTDAKSNDYSNRLTYTFTVGVYLAINAIRDAYLLVDSPDCANSKILFIQGNHDLFSDLTSIDSYHRITNTDLHPDMMSESREDKLEETLLTMASYRKLGALFFTSMPMATILGIDYERIIRKVADRSQRPVFNVEGKSLRSSDSQPEGRWSRGSRTTADRRRRARR